MSYWLSEASLIMTHSRLEFTALLSLVVIIGTVYRINYFTTASKKGRVRFNQIPFTIGVNGSPDISATPIGEANQVGRTDDGLALWRLWVRKAEVPGVFIIVDGAFVEVEAGPQSD
jgi:hypothetical protein